MYDSKIDSFDLSIDEQYIKYSYDDNGNIITNNENTTIETIDPISENNNLIISQF